MKPIFQHPDAARVALVEGFLVAQGIEVTVTNDDLSGVFGGVPVDPSTLPTIWVQDEDVERAEELLAERALELGEAEDPDLETE